MLYAHQRNGDHGGPTHNMLDARQSNRDRGSHEEQIETQTMLYARLSKGDRVSQKSRPKLR